MRVTVCLSDGEDTLYLRNHTRDVYQIFVHVAYGRGSVLLRQGDEIPREGTVLWVSSPLTMHCIDFLFKFNRKYEAILYRFQDIITYFQKIKEVT